MSPPLVSFRGVRKSHDGRTDAVHDLTFDIAAGELMSLLGPSGAGKTTTLMLLAGFERPDGGDILVGGAPITPIAPHKRGIGVVFQDPALFPQMTVAENVAFPLRMRGVDGAERQARVVAALEMVRLDRLAERLPSQLSGGQRQRAAIARALVFAPRLVLLDEPFGALDRTLRDEMQVELRRLHARLGITLLHVTHDQGEAMTLADRIAVLADGRLRQIDTPQALYDNPASLFVARFVGDNNFLAGRVEAIEDDEALVRLDCGATVAARAVDVAPGDPCQVAVRPERIAVAAISAAEMGEGALPATVVEVIHLGDQVRLMLELTADGRPATIMVKRPAAAPLVGMAPGEAVAIAWQEGHARAFRAAG